MSNSARELSNLNGNPKHKIGRKDIGLEFYVPISIFTAAKRAIWGYMNIFVYNLCRITMPRGSMRIWSELCPSHLSWSCFLPSAQECIFLQTLWDFEIPTVFFFYSATTKSTNNFDIIYTHFSAFISPHADCRCLSRWNLVRAGALCPVPRCGFVTLWYLCWLWGQATSLCLCPTSWFMIDNKVESSLFSLDEA